MQVDRENLIVDVAELDALRAKLPEVRERLEEAEQRAREAQQAFQAARAEENYWRAMLARLTRVVEGGPR